MKVVTYKCNNKGFSLIEVIVSIVILAILTLPLLNYFVSAADYDAHTSAKQTAITLAQSIMDQCKDTKIEEIAEGFHATSATELNSSFRLVSLSKIVNPMDSSKPEDMVEEIYADGSSVPKRTAGSFVGGQFTTANSADGCLYYKIRNIMEGENRYDALITFDMNNQLGDSYYSTNASNLYDIKVIHSPNNLIASETTQNTLGEYAMKALNSDYCAVQNSAHAGDAAWIMKVPADDSLIHSSLVRDIYIDLAYDTDTTVKAKVYYKYYCNGIEGCPASSETAKEIDPPVYCETVKLADLRNLYLFFQNNTFGTDVKLFLNIDTMVQSRITQKLNLYILGQAADSASNTVAPYHLDINQVNASYNKIDKIYTNTNDTTLDGVYISTYDYISSFTKLRMMNVKVDIYQAGELNQPQFLYATLSSTKSE